MELEDDKMISDFLLAETSAAEKASDFYVGFEDKSFIDGTGWIHDADWDLLSVLGIQMLQIRKKRYMEIRMLMLSQAIHNLEISVEDLNQNKEIIVNKLSGISSEAEELQRLRALNSEPHSVY